MPSCASGRFDADAAPRVRYEADTGPALTATEPDE